MPNDGSIRASSDDASSDASSSNHPPASDVDAGTIGTGERKDNLSPESVAAPRGYGHPDYAESLSQHGEPVRLPSSGGHALVRSIPGTSHVDAMGPYPLMVCPDWSQLRHDLEDRRGDWVSFTCVVDPLGPPPETLEHLMPTLTRPFKSHWLVDLQVEYDDATSKHHRYYARRAVRDGVETVCVDTPADHLGVWTRLYKQLIERHDITGMQAFSRHAFAQQLRVPGITMFVASIDGEPVSAHLWYDMGDVAYSHLAAHNERGYETSASYALHRHAIDHFRSSARWVNLGGGAGGPSDELDGLQRFKKGWATTRKPSHLCGYVLDPEAYEALAPSDVDAYFPAYRAGEMTS